MLFRYLFVLFLFFNLSSYAQNFDCSLATQICSNSSQIASPTGFGTQELNASNRGCIQSNETSSAWYILNIQTSGTLAFTIDPSGSVDYDFALWGPVASLSSCSSLGVPIRCSYAAPVWVEFCSGAVGQARFNTGLRASQTTGDVSEPAGDFCIPVVNGFVQRVNATAGQTYLLLVNNYDNSARQFTLSFTGTAVLGCPTFPLDRLRLSYKENEDNLAVYWTATNEINVDKYTLEQLVDSAFTKIYEVPAQNAALFKYLYFVENKPAESTLFRVKSIDFDGVVTYSNVVEYVPKEVRKPYSYSSLILEKFELLSDLELYYQIYDVSTRLILEGQSNVPYDVSNLSTGFYILKVDNYSYHKLFKR